MTKLSEEGMSKAQDRKIFLVLKKKRERDGGTFEGKKKKSQDGIKDRPHVTAKLWMERKKFLREIKSAILVTHAW